MKLITRFYLKSIRRKLFSKPLFPAISMAGLTIGFVSTVLVTIWLRDELSYDSFNARTDRIYRLTIELSNKSTGFHWNFARSSFGWLQNMKKEIPGIASMVMISCWESGCIKADNNVWHEEIFYADSSLTDIFTLHFLKGSPRTCLLQPGQVIISQSMAHKFFGNGEALGKTIFLYCSVCLKQKPYQVTGVFNDLPSNSHIHFKIIASRDKPVNDDEWCYNYLLLKNYSTPGNILRNFNSFAPKYMKNHGQETLTPYLQKITDIHLHSFKDRELEENGSLQQVFMVSGLAMFVLFITLFNFFTIRYVSLIKEFKSLQVFQFAGAKAKSLFAYQALESLVYSLVAASISFVIIRLIYNDFNLLIGKQEFAGSSMVLQTTVISLLSLILITVLTGMLPYLVFKTSLFVKAKKINLQSLSSSHFSKSGGRSRTLRLLLGVQYISTFVLIICVIVINDQLRLFSHYQLGQNRQKTLCIQEIPVQVINKYQLFKEELLRNPLISDITSSMEDPGYEIEDMSGFETSGVDNDTSKKLLYVNPVDDNFFSFYNIKVKAGTNFPKFSGNDSIPENYILNEKAVQYLGWKNDEEAIGKSFRLKNDYVSKKPGIIVGIVSNFQPSSVKKAIKPYVFFQKSFFLFSAQVKYDTVRQAQSLDFIRSSWSKIYPDFPFSYTFVDDLYKKVYKNEFQLRDIGSVLCLLAILLSSLGLFGVTGIVYEAHTKEIGIRKVNGARFGEITRWLLKDNLLVVSVALLIAAPLAWCLMQRWLQNYAFKITMSVWIFLLGGAIVSFVALITVSWQTWRAATRNPVESLRYE